MAFTQTNARLILGYSSMAQLGFITLGIFAARQRGAGAQGALLQAVNHGLVVAPMFFVVALLAERAGGSEDLRDMGGIAFRAPVLAGLFLIAALATLAMPGSANFAGEFLILLGAFNSEDGVRVHRLRSASCWRPCTRCGMYIRTMHNRTGAGRHVVRDVAARRARAGAADPRDRRVRAVPAGGARRRRARGEGGDGARRCRPAAGATAAEVLAVIALFAQAKVAGRTSTGRRSSPIVALTDGACIVLLVGLARARFIRTRARAAAHHRRRSARRSGCASGSGARTSRSSPTRWRWTTSRAC